MRIAAALPVNRVAAKVISRGVHFKPQHKPSVYEVRDNRPALKPWAETTGEDLTGRRVGRFTVVGYSAERQGRWVVRCDCGLYEFRRSKAIKNPTNDGDRCLDCRQTFFITHGHAYTEALTKSQRILKEGTMDKKGKGCGSMPQGKQQPAAPAQPAGRGHEKVSSHVRSQAQHHANTARKGGGK